MSDPDESLARIEGPWTHRAVHAGGTRFHVVEAGKGPLVLLLHGFPQFWWSWRNQLVSLPAAGYHTVAVDLRGYGASDKPPRGYDLRTLAADATGLIRALGETGAIVVGHDWGGLLAWTMAAMDPKTVLRLVPVAAPHPLRLRSALLTEPFGQLKANRYALGFQLPLLPERRLTANEGAMVGRMLDQWSGPGWPEEDVAKTYRDAFRIPNVAHCALEYHRWFARSQLRPDGLRYARTMRAAINAPTLQLHGALDGHMLPRTAQGSSRYVVAPYRWRLIEGAGHFPHEERPEEFDAELIGWLADPEPDR
ncbi:alpha/beta fold hydrolase [Streptosporangium subroseum]|uniref:Pimeloyl-ACP methyl ester carboxylesterase n=1 Tax=Streptosporangium subroseum TaxID=106412 RepID=A0A239II38_9ACTN|nr:alpha/beta hydrolase [Streptosporangium subroseum]WSA16787.1 alpha/beta hydrolase [Streptosporangium subroseum]SNS93189.1 Pimeloyl-ACP methyl ester carboxylesterase [Streptosporangium subroseum]